MKKIEGYVYAKPDEYTPDCIQYHFWAGIEKDGSPSDYWLKDGYVPVAQHTIEFEAIDPQALIEGQVMCLLARKQRLETDYTVSVKKIDDAIANLRCLTLDERGMAS